MLNLKVLFLVIFVSCYQLCWCNDCTFSGYSGTPVFLQQFGKSSLLLPNPIGGVNIPDQQAVIAHCPEYFENLRIKGYNYKNTSDISSKCDKNAVTLEPLNGQRVSFTTGPDRLHCPPSRTHVCEYPVEGCNGNGYILTNTIKEVSIVYSEVCYDLAKMQTQFVHYVVAERTPVLDHQDKYNPGWTSNDMTCEDIGNIIDRFSLTEEDKDSQLKSLLGDYSKIVDYQSESLIPQGLFAPYLLEPELGNWVNMYWWTPLKEGNWQMFQNALKNKSKEVDLDVYAGTSHTISFKTTGKYETENQLKFNLHLCHTNYAEICIDICETIPWMNSLKYARHMPALGYIICCDPYEVRDLLEGFPQTVVPKVHPKTTTPAATTTTTTTTAILSPLNPYAWNVFPEDTNQNPDDSNEYHYQ